LETRSINPIGDRAPLQVLLKEEAARLRGINTDGIRRSEGASLQRSLQ